MPIYWKEWTRAVNTHCRHSNQLISISFATSLREMVAQNYLQEALLDQTLSKLAQLWPENVCEVLEELGKLKEFV